MSKSPKPSLVKFMQLLGWGWGVCLRPTCRHKPLLVEVTQLRYVPTLVASLATGPKQ